MQMMMAKQRRIREEGVHDAQAAPRRGTLTVADFDALAREVREAAEELKREPPPPCAAEANGRTFSKGHPFSEGDSVQIFSRSTGWRSGVVNKVHDSGVVRVHYKNDDESTTHHKEVPAAQLDDGSLLRQPESSSLVQQQWQGLLRRGERLAEQVTQMKASSSGAAYLSDIKVDDERVRKHWTLCHPPLPVYAAAAAMISLEPEFMSDTMLLRHVREASALFGDDLKRLQDSKAFERVLEAAILKGYALRSASEARKQPDILSGGTVFGAVKKVYDALEGWKRPALAGGEQY